MSEVTGFKDRRYPSVGLLTLIAAFLLQLIAMGIWAGTLMEKVHALENRVDHLERINDSR